MKTITAVVESSQVPQLDKVGPKLLDDGKVRNWWRGDELGLFSDDGAVAVSFKAMMVVCADNRSYSAVMFSSGKVAA